MEGRLLAELEMKEVIASLECQLVDVLNAKETMTSLERQLTESLSTSQTIMAEVKALKEGTEVRRLSSFDRDRKARVELSQPPIFKGVRDSQEEDNFEPDLENYFKCNKPGERRE